MPRLEIQVPGVGKKTVEVDQAFTELTQAEQAREVENIALDLAAREAGGGTVGDVARTALGQGLAFGFGDEITAGIKSAFTDQSYDQALAQERAAIDRFSRDNPGTATALEIGGGLLAGGGTGLAARGLIGVGRQAVKRGAALAAAEGGLAGIGQGRTTGERVKGAAVGGVLGGLLGATGAVAGDAIAAARRPGLDVAPGSRAEQLIARSVDDAEGGVDELVARLERQSELSGGETTLADVDPQFARLARTATTTAGPADAQARALFAGRNARHYDRLQSKVEGGLGETQDLFDFRGETITARQEAASPLYKQALPQGVTIEGPLKEALGNEGLITKGLLKKARAFKGDFGPVNIGPGATVDDMHAIQQALQDVISKAKKSGANNTARVARGIRETIMDETGVQVPVFREATEAWADESANLAAADMGFNIYKANVRELQRDVARFTPSELSSFRKGAREAIVTRMSKGKFDRNQVSRIFGTPEQEGLLSVALRPSEIAEFKQFVNNEMLMRAREKMIVGGSPTARIQQDYDKLMEMDPLDLWDMLSTGGQAGLVRKAIGVGADLFRATREEQTQRELGKRLFDRNLAANRRTLRGIQETRQARERALAAPVAPGPQGVGAGLGGAIGGLFAGG